MQVYGFDPDALGLVRGKYQGETEIHVQCPFHSGSGTSAEFNLRTGAFYCFKCGAKATVSELANQLGGAIVKTFIDPVEKDEDNWRVNLQAPIDVANSYLLSRGVTAEQIAKHEIRSLPDGVGIPIKDWDGSTHGMVIRKYKGSHRYIYAGKRLSGWPLSNMPSYDRRKPIIVVEGVFGALRGEKYGWNVIASLGVMIKKELVVKWLSQFHHTIAVFDPDDGGYKGYVRLLKYGKATQVVIPGFPTDESDENMWDYFVNKAKKTDDRRVIERILRGRNGQNKDTTSEW